MFARRRGRPAGRRSGPPDEQPWWDPADQSVVEAVSRLDRRGLGKGWRSQSMVNNVERLDPLGPDGASGRIRAVRDARVLRALDEGQAWRHRDGRGLMVVRAEAYADPNSSAHRAVWAEHGEAALSATWRQGWSDRGRPPGWIEARALPASTVAVVWDRAGGQSAVGPVGSAALDWWMVEDHTDLSGGHQVTVYEHVMVWAGRGLATVTVRHELGTDVEEPTARAAAQVLASLRSRLSAGI